MNRRGFIGKLLALLGVGVVAPKVWGVELGDKPATPVPHAWVPECTIVPPVCTRRYLVPLADVPRFINGVLGGIDPKGEPNVHRRECSIKVINGKPEWVVEHVPVGHYNHCPMRHPEYPWMFATAARVVEAKPLFGGILATWQPDPREMVEITFAPLPFDISHLPPYPDA